MSAGGRSPFWARGRRPQEHGARPFWAKQSASGARSSGAVGTGSSLDRGAGSSGGRGAGSSGGRGAGSSGGGQARRGLSRGGPGLSGGGPGLSGGGRGLFGGGRELSASAPGPAGSLLGWVGVRAAALLAIVVVLVGSAGFLLQRADGGPVAARARSTGHDALWMGHAWLDGHHSPADLRLLAAHVHGSGIRDVYVFAGGLDSEGRLAPAAYATAGAFLASFHAACPGVRVSTWLSGVVGSGHINLGDRATRGHILAAAAAAMRAGFTGVHYDLERVTSGDLGLLALLGATRELHPAPLSVAVPKLEPLPGLLFPAQLAARRPVFWTSGYLTQIADRVDQVAVMSYDTGMPFQSWYGGYVERETALALRAVPRRTALLMGVPASHNGNLGHHAGAETVAAAIHGLRVALTAGGRNADRDGGSDSGSGGDFGVALFADYSATSRDWTAYLQNWVRPR